MLITSLKVFVVRGFGAASGFLLTLLVANFSQKSDAGVFFLCFAVINFLGYLFSLGSPQFLIKMVSSGADRGWEEINSSISIVVGFVILSYVLAFVLACFFSETLFSFFSGRLGRDESLFFIVVGAFFFSLVQVLSSVLQGKGFAVLSSSVQNVVAPAFFVAIIVSAILFDVDLNNGVLLSVYVFSLFMALGAGAFFWFKDSQSSLMVTGDGWRSVLQNLAPLFIASAMVLSVQWGGQIAVGLYLSVDDVANFSTAQRTALLVGFVLISVNTVVAPKFAKAFSKGDMKAVDKLSLSSGRLMFIASCPAILVMLVLPEKIMGLFGPEYVMAAPLLQVMAVGQFFNVLTGSVGYLLTMTNHEREFRNLVVFSGFVSISLVFFLVQAYGAIGAAYATSLSLILQNLLGVIYVKKHLGFNTLNLLRKVG